MAAAPKTFAFVFPMATGHFNPSLALARSLVDLGHSVHYLCFERMQRCIEDTGAAFHSAVEYETELYGSRDADVPGAFAALKREHGLEEESFIIAYQKLQNVQLELQLPGVLRFLRAVKPDAVLYCPVINREAPLAASLLGLASIALLTFAGPGSRCHSQRAMLREVGIGVEALEDLKRGFEPNVAAARRLRSEYGIAVQEGVAKPFGRMDVLRHSALTLVTTSEALQDRVPPELASAYREEGSKFCFVGPLLDQDGAARAGTCEDDARILQKVRWARTSGRQVVLVSMGTVITSDTPGLGWSHRPIDAAGQPHGLTGKQLCQAAWSAAFDAFGEDAAESGPLILVAVGLQPDPMSGIAVPPNAVCAQNLPQVDILRAGVDAFLTHCGQNSFMEAMANRTPVVCCPGFGDQFANARKAVDVGVGLAVDRPHPPADCEATALLAYRADVRQALRRVFTEASFREAAGRCAEDLRGAGGVPKAVELIVDVARGGASDDGAVKAAMRARTLLAAGA